MPAQPLLEASRFPRSPLFGVPSSSVQRCCLRSDPSTPRPSPDADRTSCHLAAHETRPVNSLRASASLAVFFPRRHAIRSHQRCRGRAA
jgi:hypothetical protein